MHVRQTNAVLIVAITVAALVSPITIDTLNAQALPRQNNGRGVGQNPDPYELGYREGARQGEQDARRGRDFGLANDRAFRDGDRGYDRRFGSRDAYRDRLRAGFTGGYRDSYERIRGAAYRQSSRRGGVGRQSGRGYQEPAFARGYADGYEEGLRDARERDRYDPVGSRDYRNGDQGYYGSYGSRDAYKNNYRAGFRQGYDDGYRRR